MKKGIVFSIILILLGCFFECLHLITDFRPFEIKFWILGIGCMAVGFLGLLWFMIVPVLEDRADTLGNFKREKRKNN